MADGGKMAFKNLDIFEKENSKIFFYLFVVNLGGFLFCGNRKLTNFHGGKRKYSVMSTDFGHKNNDVNGNIIF